MAGGMGQADLVADLKRSLHDAATVFNAPDDADWIRMLGLALTAMAGKRPRTLLGSLVLTPGKAVYPLPDAEFQQYKSHLWGGQPCKPWSPGYPGALPRVAPLQDGSTWQLVFDPAPTWEHINAHGSTFRFWYFGSHVADADGSTVAYGDRPLLLLRAQAEAMRELSMRNVNKPVQLRDGVSGTPRNSTPAALYRELLDEWERAR